MVKIISAEIVNILGDIGNRSRVEIKRHTPDSILNPENQTGLLITYRDDGVDGNIVIYNDEFYWAWITSYVSLPDNHLTTLYESTRHAWWDKKILEFTNKHGVRSSYVKMEL